ncbi:MAG TPA: hypothetical protein VJV23_09325 [Candidatus Polarisedimenticolia bacterium]|nr:hypothetical protein [Candidatus Polarisedimenticolia bacterium]
MGQPQTVICTYRLQNGKEAEFTRLLERHWPTLRKAGLATDTPPQIYKGKDESGKTFIVEIFSWKDEQAPGIAHQLPEVMAVWEPMGALVEERLGRPKMEFPHVQPVRVSFATA